MKADQKPADVKARFLEVLSTIGTVTHACNAAGIARHTAYKWRKTDEKFAEAWEQATVEVVEKLEASAYQRAMGGDTTLTIFLLKAARPERYRDQWTIRHDGKIETETETDRAIRDLLAVMARTSESPSPVGAPSPAVESRNGTGRSGTP